MSDPDPASDPALPAVAPPEPASHGGPAVGSTSLNAAGAFSGSLLAQVAGARQVVLGIGVSDPFAPVRVDARIPPLHRARYRALIAAHGGIALPSAATEQLATFADPARALACALAAQTATAELAEIHETRHVAARVALDLGEIEIAERAQAVRGRPVQRVAELISLAREGVVLLTREALGALPPDAAAGLKALPPPEVNPAARLLAGVAVAGWHGLVPGPASEGDDANDDENAPADVSATSVLPLPAEPRSAAAPGPQAVESVALTHGGRTVQVEPGDCPFTLGRDRASSLVVGSETASRRHGRIEHVAGAFYFVDTSRNGSYVLNPTGEEIFVHNDRLALVSHGVISTGCPIVKQTGEVVRFNCVVPPGTPGRRRGAARADADWVGDTRHETQA